VAGSGRSIGSRPSSSICVARGRSRSSARRAAREEIKRLDRALARETLDKRIVTEALEMLKDPRWRKRVGSSE